MDYKMKGLYEFKEKDICPKSIDRYGTPKLFIISSLFYMAKDLIDIQRKR